MKIATIPIAITGIQITFFDVYETEPGVYLAVPRSNTFIDPVYGPPYMEFYFSKVGKYWQSAPQVRQDLLQEIISGCNLK